MSNKPKRTVEQATRCASSAIGTLRHLIHGSTSPGLSKGVGGLRRDIEEIAKANADMDARLRKIEKTLSAPMTTPNHWLAVATASASMTMQ